MIVKPLTDRRWEGYDFDQLQEQLALTEARIMIQKNAIQKKVKNLRNPSKGINAGSQSDSVLSRIMNYAEYAMLGFNLVRRLSPVIARLFRRKQSNP